MYHLLKSLNIAHIKKNQGQIYVKTGIIKYIFIISSNTKSNW